MKVYKGTTFGASRACEYLADTLNEDGYNRYGGKVSKFLTVSRVGFNDILNTEVMTRTLLKTWLQERLHLASALPMPQLIIDLIRNIVKHQYIVTVWKT